MSDLVRWILVLEVSVMLACGLAWQRAYRDAVPRPLWRVGWGYGWVFCGLVGSVVVNVLLDQPVTVGLWVAAVATTPAMLWVAWCTFEAVRLDGPEPRVPASRIAAVVDGAERPTDGPACNHPACLRAREELRRLTE